MLFYLFIYLNKRNYNFNRRVILNFVKTPGCSYDLTETLRTYADEVCLQMFVY